MLSPTHRQPHLGRLCGKFAWTLSTTYSTGGLPYRGFQHYVAQHIMHSACIVHICVTQNPVLCGNCPSWLPGNPSFINCYFIVPYMCLLWSIVTLYFWDTKECTIQFIGLLYKEVLLHWQWCTNLYKIIDSKRNLTDNISRLCSSVCRLGVLALLGAYVLRHLETQWWQKAAPCIHTGPVFQRWIDRSDIT